MIHANDIHGSQLHLFDEADFAVLPLGSYEYHGPSSPYGTDQLLAESFANRIDSTLNGLIYSGIPYTLCPGKTSRYQGTISISSTTTLLYIEEVCKGILASGVKNIILLNAHDANMSIARTVAESLTGIEKDARFLLINWWQMVEIDRAEELGFQQTKGRGHGGPFEMSAVKYLQPEWIADARESMRVQQEMVIQDLEEKVAQAPAAASDEFLYQDKEESRCELDVAKKILADIPKVLTNEHFQERIWNLLPYHRYRGSDEPNEQKEDNHEK